MSLKLNPMQRRVLGVLIEKSLTTPASYPLSINALVVGCNQLTCRDPIMHATEAEVSKAVYDLQRMLLVKQADPDRNARVNRFKHNVDERWGWDHRQRAVIAELLLRGPQTVGEIKSNASRMTPITDLQYVVDLLATFAQQDPPLVCELPRQPGRSAVRFDHMFYPDDEQRLEAVAAPPAPSSELDPAVQASLEARVARLEQAVAALQAEVETLRGSS